MPQLPMTGDDLRVIADLCDKADVLSNIEGSLLTSPFIGKIEVFGEGNILIGYLEPIDDWYGFVPLQNPFVFQA